MRGIKRGSEDEIQATFIEWVRRHETCFPELKLIYAIGNGGHRSPVTAWRMKQTGTRRGIPDIHLPIARNGKHGLWIEFKTPTGKLSPEQTDVIAELKRGGFEVAMCRSWMAAANAVINYLGLPISKISE